MEIYGVVQPIQNNQVWGGGRVPTVAPAFRIVVRIGEVTFPHRDWKYGSWSTTSLDPRESLEAPVEC